MVYFFLAYTEPSLKALLNVLHPVCASWYNIGLELDIPYTILDSFRHEYLDTSDLMREMLKYWFKTAVYPPPTWEAIVAALRSLVVNESHLAEQLESKYCAPVKHMMDESNDPIKAEGNVWVRGLE